MGHLQVIDELRCTLALLKKTSKFLFCLPQVFQHINPFKIKIKRVALYTLKNAKLIISKALQISLM